MINDSGFEVTGHEVLLPAKRDAIDGRRGEEVESKGKESLILSVSRD